MPELPEVETTRRGLEGLLLGRRIEKVTVHDRRLRYPVDVRRLRSLLRGRRIEAVERRAKYLLFHAEGGRAILAHLGMTGRFLVCDRNEARVPHTHAGFLLDDDRELRYVDPRRFGMLEGLRTDEIEDHFLLADLGPEPLGPDFDGAHLHAAGRRSRRSVKSLIMDSKVVVGVGNIYASESLWRAGIHPHRAAGRISFERHERLARSIREVLREAVARGGTTLRDFLDPEGRAGYFSIELEVYDREDEPCRRCQRPIRRSIIQNRSTFHCPACQT